MHSEVVVRRRLTEEGFNENARFYVKNDADKRQDCERCKSPCYLSAVMCRYCGADSMVCIRHARSLCSCPPGGQGKILFYWHKIEDLQVLLTKVEKRAFGIVKAGVALAE